MYRRLWYTLYDYLSYSFTSNIEKLVDSAVEEEAKIESYAENRVEEIDTQNTQVRIKQHIHSLS